MLSKLYSWYGTRLVRIVLALLAILILVSLYLAFFKAEPTETPDEVKKEAVNVKSVKNINFENSFSSVGIVEAISEAQLQTEAGGRITAVSTEIGQTVRAGAIIASIENASERAMVLQAQGVYEAALAGSASGEVTVAGAELALASALKSAVTTYQSTFITVDDVLHNTIDDYFTINNGVASGFKLDGRGKAPELNSERTSLESDNITWSKKLNLVNEKSVSSELTRVQSIVQNVANFAEKLAVLAQEQEVEAGFSQADKDVVNANITSARVAINAVLSQIEGVQTQIDVAQKSLQQAELAGAQGLPSASSAQVKIALGSLRSAQASYEKTLVRSPISGVVNALYLKTGEYVSPGQPAAVIANNNGLQVTTAVSEENSAALAVGDTVSINEGGAGTIIAIAGAIDPTTGKVSVKISVDDTAKISNGSTVTISFTQSEKIVNETITIPLSSIKMTGSGPIAFEVVEGKLKSIPLTLGEISGDSVVITSGLSLESQIVVDARGLKDGTEVEVTTN